MSLQIDSKITAQQIKKLFAVVQSVSRSSFPKKSSAEAVGIFTLTIKTDLNLDSLRDMSQQDFNRTLNWAESLNK